jgi:hypothetical protein
VGEVARSRRGRVLAKTTVKNAPTSRKSARRFTQAEKGKSKGEYYFSSYLETLIHLPIATDFDIEMADPEPVLPAAAAAIPIPDLDRLTAHLEEVERTMYEQTRWVEERLWEPLAQMSHMRATLRSLTSRLDNLEGYLGLQDGAQPIVLYNGAAYDQVENIPGGPSWRQEMGIVEAVGADKESSDVDAEHDKGEAGGPAEARPAQ